MRQEDRRIAALAKKNAAKVVTPQTPKEFDSTLQETETTNENRQFFKDMKRREF